MKDFIDKYFCHFNSATLKDAAKEYVNQLKFGNKMMVAMGGAMSTAEVGKLLAEMIRKGYVHAVSTTGANIEEDLFNLVAHNQYKRIPNYRDLTPAMEVALLAKNLNRITDTCIPEDEAMRRIEQAMVSQWQAAAKDGLRLFNWEFYYKVIRSGALNRYHEIDPKDSWVIAACEKDLPIYTPGWEDSTMGNIFTAAYLKAKIDSLNCVKSGPEQMQHLIEWYRNNTKENEMGFIQVGGGISGDFAICVVPLIRQDLNAECKLWSYFCQISDSTTSYGSYSGATPTEKITWEKIGADTPRFVIESDATIVLPLIFAYVMEAMEMESAPE